MRTKLIIGAAFAALIAAVTAPSVEAQDFFTGVGPVEAASASPAQLPQPALDFLNKYYKDVRIKRLVHEFPENTYEADLANGVDVEFDARGRVLEIDAPDRAPFLAPEVVKAILPSAAHNRLKDVGKTEAISKIEHRKGNQYKIKSATQPEELYFDFIEGIWVPD